MPNGNKNKLTTVVLLVKIVCQFILTRLFTLQTKLVQNEDDASVALHVSNALTQALLQYRMTNIQDEVWNIIHLLF